MSDISEFLQSYNETLQQGIVDADMPHELTERFDFDSCVKQQDGQEVYFITQKSDGIRAVLRITDNDHSENAAAESAVLWSGGTVPLLSGCSAEVASYEAKEPSPCFPSLNHFP